jgi:hypothetical protein
MIAGVTTQDEGAVLAINPYTASAVHFGGSTIIWQSTFSSTDSRYFAFAGWFNVDWLNLHPTMFVFDPVSSFAPVFEYRQFLVPNSAATSYYGLQFTSVSPPLDSAAWQHVIGAIDSSAGHAKMYFGNIAGGTIYHTPGFVASTNGKSLFVGGDSSANITGDVADLSIWLGVSFFDVSGDIPASIRNLFVDGAGKPVGPSVAIAALGTPSVMLTGNAATFMSNSLGSAGALAYNPSFNTPLTNASTHP